MNTKEKEILKKTVESNQGLLSPAEFINGICERNNKAAHNLISIGYIEEVPITKNNMSFIFYRATEKGRSIFYPLYKRLWYLVKGDIRTILVSTITAIVITLITIWINNNVN